MRKAVQAPPGGVGTTGLFLCGVVAALALAWLSTAVNLRRACVVQDTPYLDLCPRRAWGSDAHLATLRSRIAANPGDANAYAQLARADRSPDHARTLHAASRIAPSEPNVLVLQATAALERQDWPQAIEPLVDLVEYRNVQPAAMALARLIAGGQGALLQPHVKAGSQWLARVLAQMPQIPSALPTALPLIVHGLKLGALDPDAVREFVRQLKTAGAWTDAYSLWLALHGKPLPALYNGGFDEALQSGGFDWELTAGGPLNRTGAIVERNRAAERGGILEVRFTGRGLAVPLARQYLFLSEGRYRLRGEYQARQFRMERGLAWVVRCGANVAARSDMLGDTGGGWRAFVLEFPIPAACGAVASLQLETHDPAEAALGARGRMAFDAFSLEKMMP